MLEILSRSKLRTLTQPEYLVHKVIPKSGLVTLVAEPGSKKSFVAVHIACCIATGLNCFGKRVQNGQVIYLAAEGAAGLNKRILAWEDEQSLSVKDDKFALIGSAVAINEPSDFNELVTAIKAREAEYGAIDLIVVDTVNRTLSGDENNARDMTTYVRKCTELIEAFGASVLLIHHPSKSAPGARGHSSLNGAADQGLEIKGGKNHAFVLKLDAKPPKNDEPAPDMRLRIKPKDLSAHLGFDEAGEPITSLALEQVTGPIQAGQNEQVQTLGNQLIGPIKDALAKGTLAKRHLLASLVLEGVTVSTKTIERALTDLCDKGTLYKPSHGHYALAKDEIDTEE